MDAVLRVLVVDDNRNVAESTVALIQAFKHHARAAYDGLAAISTVPIYLPHVILMHIDMLDMDGWETGRRIRELQGGKNTVLVALTECGRPAKQNGQQTSFDHHFIAPLSVDVLELLLEVIDYAVH